MRVQRAPTPSPRFSPTSHCPGEATEMLSVGFHWERNQPGQSSPQITSSLLMQKGQHRLGLPLPFSAHRYLSSNHLVGHHGSKV